MMDFFHFINAYFEFVQITKAFLPEMLSSNHGHIVSIASLAGHTGLNRLTDYCASKFAAVGFMEALSLELYQEGMRLFKNSLKHITESSNSSLSVL